METGVLMEGSQGSLEKGRPLARPAVGPVPAPQGSAAPGPVVSTTFWLLSCRIVHVRSGPSGPSFVGACGARISLRRSFVAYFLREFPGPCPLRVDRLPSATAPQASPAAKTTGERGRWPVT
jgi:hypothetical protein